MKLNSLYVISLIILLMSNWIIQVYNKAGRFKNRNKLRLGGHPVEASPNPFSDEKIFSFSVIPIKKEGNVLSQTYYQIPSKIKIKSDHILFNSLDKEQTDKEKN